MDSFVAAIALVFVVFVFGSINGQKGITNECANFNAFTSLGVKYTCEKVGK